MGMETAKKTNAHGIRRWWQHHAIATVDHVDVIQKVHEESAWSPRYLFMILMSAGIALLGLLLSSPAVVIGAMLISPLMGPIIGVGFALALFDFDELKRSATALALGAVIAVLFTALIVAVSPIQTVTSEIAARTRPNLFDLLVALFSALAGSYAMIRGKSGTIVGVAIATALMPPLAVVGFGLATWNSAVFGGALLLFITNLITIALSATLMARLYGFASHLSPSQSRWQGALLIATLVILSVPLALTLRQIAWETLAARQARDVVRAQFAGNARLSDIDVDYAAEPLTVRAEVLTPALVANANAKAIAELSRQLERPVNVEIYQVRIGSAARDAETAELAAAQAGELSRVQESQVATLLERLSVATGASKEQVTLDRTNRRVIVAATPLPGATMAAYRLLEQRAAANMTGWSVTLIPPAAPLPSVRFTDDVPDAAALDTAAWAQARIRVPIGVAGGTTAQADVVLDELKTRKVDARRSGSAGTLRLEWLAPEESE
ncbi:uncharacterized hydrophobic domain-containing protein [Sphingomonas laterariae]|uniref:Uncharacterized hydrophobic domain-containing protein n=1 Tax=Edaphosphingomonas laterariae TaxID=861865 RepID=A0A239GN68_9SPHN|nr:DUF389 domain-containing protein [Sphingomonas laterariae]SNS70315.1 uncharacterized hydrophobic domain-containing protein [Sphingomonas laterariae]